MLRLKVLASTVRLILAGVFAEGSACEVTAATRFVAFPSGADPVIYLSQDSNADHRL